jgi:hypothetical protein
MSRIALTIRDGAERRNFDMDLPGDVPVAQLIADLVDVLEWPFGDSEGRPIPYVLKQRTNGRILHQGYSLLENGVVRGEILILAPVMEEAVIANPPAIAPQSDTQNNNAVVRQRLNQEVQELRDLGYEVSLQMDESPNGLEFLVQIEGGYLESAALTLYFICEINYPHIPPQVLVEQYGEECRQPHYRSENLLQGWTSQYRLMHIVERAAAVLVG